MTYFLVFNPGFLYPSNCLLGRILKSFLFFSLLPAKTCTLFFSSVFCEPWGGGGKRRGFFLFFLIAAWWSARYNIPVLLWETNKIITKKWCENCTVHCPYIILIIITIIMIISEILLSDKTNWKSHFVLIFLYLYF